MKRNYQTDDQYVKSLIVEKDKKEQENYKKARAYLEGQKYYDKTLEDKVDFLLTEDGLVLVEYLSSVKLALVKIAEILAVTQTVFHNILRDNPTIYDAVDRGRVKELDEVEKALFKLAKGYYVKENKEKVYTNERTERESTQTEVYERYIPANFAAVSYILNNKRQQEYKDKQIEYEIAKNTIHVEIEIIGDDEVNLD